MLQTTHRECLLIVDSEFAKSCWNKPYICYKGKVKQVHRFIVTCFKMDTQEYRRVTYTRKIGSKTLYSCGKCLDTKDQLIQTSRISFHSTRSVDNVIHVAKTCKKFDDWSSPNDKNMGYKATAMDIWDNQHGFDPFHVISTDIWHGAFNMCQQFMKTLVWNTKLGENGGKTFYNAMLDICALNDIDPPLKQNNWYDKDKKLTDLTLELAPVCLV